MNYLKKKIKGHKKGHDDDDFDDYDATAEARPAENRDEGQKDSEEWKFFQQLTQRVQDTVEKSQTTLNKLKDTSAVVDLDKPEYYSDSEENENRAVRSSSWVNFEETQQTSPVVEGVSTSFKSSAPPRPPPPKGKQESELVPLDVPEPLQIPETQQQSLSNDFSLLEEFGFQKDNTTVQVSSNFLLIAENDEDADDPFDTSFVTASILPRKPAEQIVPDIPDNIFEEEPDPFDTSFVTNISTGTSGFTQKVNSSTEDKTLSSLTSPSQDHTLVPDSKSELDDMSNPFLTNTEAPLDIGGGLLNFSADEPVKQSKAKTNPFSDFELPAAPEHTNVLDSVFGDALGEDRSLQEPLNFCENSVAPTTIERKPESLPSDLFATFPQENNAADPFSAFPMQQTTDNLLDSFSNVVQNNFQNTGDPFGDSEAEQKESILPMAPNAFEDSMPENTLEFESLEVIDNFQTSEIFSNANVEDLEEKPKQRSKENSIETFIEFAQKNVDSCNFSEKNLEMFQPGCEKRLSLDHRIDPESHINNLITDTVIQENVSGDEMTNFQHKLTSPLTDAEKPLASNKNTSQDFFDLAFGEEHKASENTAPATDPFDPFSTLGSKAENDAAVASDGWTINPFDGDSSNDAFNANFLEPATDITKTSQNKIDNIDGHLFSTDASQKDLFDAPDDPFNTSNVQTVLEKGGTDAFGDPFSSFSESQPVTFEPIKNTIPYTDKATFESFAAKFEQAIEKFEDTNEPAADVSFDPFAAPILPGSQIVTDIPSGFDMFDPFAAEVTRPPENTPIKKSLMGQSSQDSFDEDDELDFSVVIKPKMKDPADVSFASLEPPPLLPPPPKSPIKAFAQQPTPVSRFNPFNMPTAVIPDTKPEELPELELPPALGEAGVKKSDSQESPTTPLFDEDTSQPLEEFTEKFQGEGWEMMLRQPSKKKITGNRYWKKVYLRLSENSVLQLFNKKEDNDPFQELPLQACYSFSEVGAQQYDAYGKIFTVKLNYIFYRERVGVRPGQLSKVMQGQITSMGQIAKLGLPLEHAPQVSQLLKLGTQTYEDIKIFVQVLEDALFHLVVHRDRALTYKTEEVQVTVHDELYVEQRRDGHVEKQKARVRLFFLAFISGMPDVEVGLNDLIREGKEVVGRYDIIPVVTEEWIRLENCEFHCCVTQDHFEKNRIVKLHPPDACLFELMRFRIRPPKNRELPLQVKVSMKITSMRVEIRADVLVPGYHSRKHGQVPCEDIKIRFPIPECWIYLFRVEKHFRYGSLKSAARRPGKIKGLERIMGTAQNLDPSLIEVSAGQAKYEHAFKAIVWRIPRLPKEGQGAYTTQLFTVKLDLTSFDQIPETFSQHVHVEFTMPATTVSHTTVRSVSVTNSNPPEKYVKYAAKHEYKVQIDFISNSEAADYALATAATAAEANRVQVAIEEDDKNQDSNESD